MSSYWKKKDVEKAAKNSFHSYIQGQDRLTSLDGTLSCRENNLSCARSYSKKKVLQRLIVKEAQNVDGMCVLHSAQASFWNVFSYNKNNWGKKSAGTRINTPVWEVLKFQQQKLLPLVTTMLCTLTKSRCVEKITSYQKHSYLSLLKHNGNYPSLVTNMDIIF